MRASLFLIALTVTSFLGRAVADEPFPEHDLDCDDDLVVELVLSDATIAQPIEAKFDERHRLWVVEYRQYPEPAGLTKLDRDEYWRVQYDRMPPPPPHAVGSPFRGKDRISIHEDTNGDGHYDTHKTFVDGLNVTTSVAFDRSGVWVLTPPYLVFYPDANHDDVPDADPVVHLRGFGIEDTHSIANSLTWGVDGWLYGGNGSTSTMAVTSPFWDDRRPAVARKGQNIWRYHPTTHAFEVFAEGGGNTFGLEIDARGHVYSGHNGGNTRGFHFVKGGFYRKSFGKHGDLTNRYAYGYFSGMAHHNVERFSHHFLIYDAEALPERFHHQLVGIDVLHRNLVLTDFAPRGSTFITSDISRPVGSTGDEFSPVDLTLGPDGNLYVADWADSAVSHLMNREGQLQPDTGRLFRVRKAGRQSPALPTFENEELLERLESPNREIRRTALRLIRERCRSLERAPSRGHAPGLSELEKTELVTGLRRRIGASHPFAQDAFWALHATGEMDSSDIVAALSHPRADLRRWAVRFADESFFAPAELHDRFASIAAEEPDVGVVIEVLAAIRNWPSGHAWKVLAASVARDDFASDTFFPLMLWWSVESTRPTDSIEWVKRFGSSSLAETSLYKTVLQERLVRTLADEANVVGWDAIAVLLQSCQTAEERRVIFAALEDSLAGSGRPAVSPRLTDRLHQFRDELSLGLRLRLAIGGAEDEALAALTSPSSSGQQQQQLLTVISETRPSGLEQRLTDMAIHAETKPAFRQRLIATLAAYQSAAIGERLIEAFEQLEKPSQAAAIELLASRPIWASQLMNAIEGGQINRKQVTPLVANRVRLLNDEAVVARAEALWPSISVDERDIAAEMKRYARRLSVGHRGQAERGKVVYQTHCANCHQFYGQGRSIGPDLTSYQRSNRELMLLALVAPSAEIREGFESAVVALDDGSVVTGILVKDNESHVELKDGQGIVRKLARSRVEALRIAPTSLMPAGLIEKLSDQDLRDLFTYLQTTR